MAFSLDQFYRLNRRALIWIILLGLLYLLGDFFGLIFLTFVLAFIAAPLAAFGQRYLRMTRRISIIAVYGLFLMAIVSFATFVTPRVIREADSLMSNLPEIEAKLLDLKKNLVAQYPSLDPLIMGYLRSGLPDQLPTAERINGEEEIFDILNEIRGNQEEIWRYLAGRGEQPAAGGDAATTETLTATKTQPAGVNGFVPLTPLTNARGGERPGDEKLIEYFMNQQAEKLRAHLVPLGKMLLRGSMTMMLALLFSFLISLDIARLSKELQSLRSSRLRDFYEQTAQPVVRFAYVVGRALQAQAMIAVTNTVLTLIGLLALGIPSIAMLSLVVFICSFIPVLGVFISTTPIMLVALNAGGIGKAIAVLLMVIGIHMIEAYVLNPMIYGKHLKLNPVLVLMILFVGHHAFGVWGMLLGVPVSYYFIHDVFGVPVWEENRLGVGKHNQVAADGERPSPPQAARK